MPPRASRSKKVKLIEEEGDYREGIEIAPLSGILTRLPYETLIEILSLCTPKTFASLLLTCKAMKGFADAEERTLYRKLYHNNIYDGKFIRPSQKHVIHSPVKQSTVTEYPLAQLLPQNAVESWKIQYNLTAKFSVDRKRCMHCDCEDQFGNLLNVFEWNLRLCPFCFASNLVFPSNLSLHQVTAKDVVGIPSIELKTEGMLGNFRNAKFYSAHHLKPLAMKKHGAKYQGPKLLEAEEGNAKQKKEDTVMVATLLQGGLSYRDHFFGAARQLDVGDSTIANNLNHELANAATGKSLGKDSGLKKRPLKDVLTDYVKFVSKYLKKVPIADQGEVPKFLPAIDPGPLIPTDATVANFAKVRELLFNGVLSRYNLLDPRTIPKIRSMQEYVLAPTESKWKNLVQIIREETNESRYRGFRQLEEKNSSSTGENFQPLIDALEIGSDGERLSDRKKFRVKFLSQLDAILGGGNLSPSTIVQLLPGKALVNNPRFGQYSIGWAQSYFDHGLTLELRKKVYKVNSTARHQGFVSFANNLLVTDSLGIGMTISLALQLLPSHILGNNQRVDKSLRDRAKVPQEVYEKEITQMMKLIRSGILSSSNVIATLHKVGRCICRFSRGSGIGCREDCWIESMNHDYYGDSDDEDYYFGEE